MGIISLDDIKSGMMLASDLIGANGRFLLPKGTVLEEKHLRVFKIWGVTQADIRGMDREKADAEMESELDQQDLERSKEFVTALFRFADPENTFLGELKRVCIKRFATDKAVVSRFFRQKDKNTAGTKVPEDQELPTAAAIISQEVQLASFPDIYFHIMEVLNNPRSSASHAAEVVSKDVGLSAKLLKLVNSPLYGFPSKIDTIQRAVTLVGSNELSMLALGVSVVQYFSDMPEDFIDMESFWKHSIACGIFAKIIAGQTYGLSEERFFIGGLIHDLGRLVLIKNSPGTAVRIFHQARQENQVTQHVEQELLGYDHAFLARLILNQWKFPDSLAQMIGNHHSPMEAENTLDASIIHIADVLAKAFEPQEKEFFYLPPLDKDAWKLLDLGPSMVGPAMNQAAQLLGDIYHSFLGPEN